MADELVPFGKYKGKPIETLATDTKYLEWLLAQDWFRQQYQNIYTLVINNFTEPTETPEHNALQVLFLDDDYCIKVIKYLYHQEFLQELQDIIERYSNYMVVYGDDNEENVSIKDVSLGYSLNPAQFEYRGIADVFIEFWYGAVGPNKKKVYFLNGYQKKNILINNEALWIELKPIVGDDYPAILRQMKHYHGRKVLFVDEYTGIGATKDQFIETFRRSNISVVFRSEIE